MPSISRHLLLLVLSASIPLLLVAAALAYLLVEQHWKSTERTLEENAKLLAHALDAELERSLSALHALARSESLREDDLEAFYAEARDVRAALGLWDNVLLLSPKAEHLLNLMRPYGAALPPVPQPEGALRAVQTRTPYISNTLKGRVETDWLMYISFPVVQAGEVRYVIGVTMSARHWSRWLAERTPASVTAGIIDREQVILARSHEGDQLAGQPVQPWYRDVLAARAEAMVRGPGVSDADVVVAFHRSKVSGWTVNVLRPAAGVYAPMRQTATAVGLALLVALAIAVALALARARKLARGVHELHDVLERLRGPAPSFTVRGSAIREIDAALAAASDTAEVLNVRGERLLRAQRAARLGLWDWDFETNNVEWSEGLYALIGVPAGAAATNDENWLEYIVPEDRTRVIGAFEGIVTRGGDFREEFRIRRTDGAIRWIACIGRVDQGTRGTATRMQGVNIDITDRKQAEELLRQSEEHFRTISHAAPAMVWVAASSGDIVFMNDRWYEYTGQTEAQAKGFGWVDAAHPEDAARLLPYWERCRTTGETYEGECRLRRRDGDYRWHTFRALPHRDPTGAIERWFGCSVDIHDAREAREALREADRRKDEFLATLAHELRNPLAPIRNAVQLLKRGAVDHPAVRTAQEIMDRQVDHMVRLIDDLLDVSRITRGKLELRRQPVELTRVVQQAVETSRPNIRQQFSVSLPSEPIHVHGDAVRLAQVLANLLNNAAKYTEPDGRIALTAAREGDQVCIRISDTGIGIDPEQLPNLFQMFSQARPALARSEGGLGIGLSLARSLVEMHGGTISASSAGLGRGSEFSVRLPIMRAPSVKAHAQQPAQPYSAAMRRVLVVDDVPDSVRSLAALLRLDGNEVETAADGIEALEKAHDFRPDFIFLDLGLPRMNGYDVCRSIRGHAWGKDVFIVALTGWGQDGDRARTLAAGFNVHLVKPVGYETLRNVLASSSMS
jgi:PAS domain S-box-containing protein